MCKKDCHEKGKVALELWLFVIAQSVHIHILHKTCYNALPWRSREESFDVEGREQGREFVLNLSLEHEVT